MTTTTSATYQSREPHTAPDSVASEDDLSYHDGDEESVLPLLEKSSPDGDSNDCTSQRSGIAATGNSISRYSQSTKSEGPLATAAPDDSPQVTHYVDDEDSDDDSDIVVVRNSPEGGGVESSSTTNALAEDSEFEFIDHDEAF
ncbi:hypothetical protein NP233_g10981 [Leucocoprinus birnbaumii]|uniref:Uncharacterized protein n=1 Tax=Leucocoprinus birnbaumii TaxID=56174 RepID=A0AAD5VHV7_9AGAR|nr:hypothetical protein NP233_g10981 [Leucocoprinus birnbaumii]